jgi:hypothetical protein
MGKDLARGIEQGGFRQAFAPILRRFDKFSDEAGKSIAAKIGKGAKRAEGDMFGLADAVKEVERRSKATSRASKSLGGDMFGVGKAAKRSGKDLRSATSQLSDWHSRANASEKVAKKLGDGIRGMGADFSSVVRKLRVGSGDFSGFNGAMSRINRTFSFFGNILRTLKLPAFAAAIGLTAQALSALAAAAVATTSALGPLAGLLVALPAGALAAAQAFGVLKLATSGVGDAVKAAFALQVKGGQQAIDTMRQQEDAAEAVADAERGLTDAKRQAEIAQTSLTEAHADARRELQDLQLAAEAAHDAEQAGNLSLIQARKDLANTLKDPKATGLDIRFAEEAVDQARNDLKQTRLDAKRARKDNADAQKDGVKGMPQVVAANEALADAKRGVEEADRGLTKALQAQTDAMKEQGSAADSLQEKLAELPPAARKFAKFLISLKPRLDALRETAAKGFFPGATRGIKGALKNFGVFKGIVGETSKALGRFAAKAGSKLGGEAWGRDLGKIGALNTRILGRMGDATLNVADAFRNVLVSAEPFLDWLSKGTEKFSEWIKSESQAGRESGRLEHFFDETRKTMERIWPILKGVGGALLNIGKAAKPLGDEILDSLGKSAEGWRKWADSTKGQNTLKRYFREVKPAIWEVGRLVRDAGKAFFELGRQPGVANLLRLIRTTLIPALRDLAGATTGFASGFLGQVTELRREGVPLFDAFLETLISHAGEAGLRIVKAIGNSILHASLLGKLAIGTWLLTKFGGKGALLRAGASLGGWLGAGISGGISASVSGAESVFGAGGGKAAGKGLLGRLKGIKWGRVGGLGLGALLADGVLNEFQRHADERSDDLTTSLFAKADTQSGVEKTLTGLTNFVGFSGNIDAPSFGQIFGGDEEQKNAANLLAQLEEMRKKRVQLSAATLRSLEAQAREVDLTKQAREQLDRMFDTVRAGRKIGTKVDLGIDPKRVHQIVGGFDFLRKGIGANLGDIAKVSKRTANLIRSTFGEGTKEARNLTARNMRLTAQAIADQMARSGDVTKKGLERIKSLFRTADLISPSRKQAEGFGREWSKGMDHTKEVTAKGIQAMISEAQKMPGPMRKVALETWLDQAKAAQRSGDLTVDAFRKMRSRVFAEFGQIQSSGKTFNRELATSFVDMVNNSGGAMGVLMTNVSNLLGTLGGKGKLSWKILNAKLSEDPNGKSLGRQKGGPVPARALGGLAATVPGNSTGDRHTLSLNGRPVAKVESREGIFVGNRKMMGAVSAANDAVPRFQTGGLLNKPFNVDGAKPGFVPFMNYLNSMFGPIYVMSGLRPGATVAGSGAPSNHATGSAADISTHENGLNFATDEASLNATGRAAKRMDALHAFMARYIKLPGDFLWRTFTGGNHYNHIHRGITSSEADDPGLMAQYLSKLPKGDLFGPLKKFVLDGPDGPMKELGQRAIDSVWKAANAQMQRGFSMPTFGTGRHPRNAHEPLKGQKGRFLGLIKHLRSGGYVGNINHPWAEHNSGTGDWGGPTLPSYVVAALAEAAGDELAGGNVPGVEAEQITRGESGSGKANSARPGATGEDPGGTKGWGLWMTTTTFNDEVAAKLGGYSKLLNPVKSAAAMAQTWPGVYYGDKYVTSPGAHYDGNYDIRNALGGATFKEALEGKAPGNVKPEEGLGGGKSAEKTPAEKVPGTYGGVSTQPLSFGQPKTLEQVEAELRKLVGDDGKSGLAKKYRRAIAKADKESKPATVKALQKNLNIIEQRVAGLRSMRTKLRMAKAKKALAENIKGKLSKLAGYDQRIDGSQRLYEVAAQYAEQVVALEPESPEVAAEPELEQAPGESDKAFEKKRRDARNAYEASREATEKDYVGRYSAYVEGQERPAYQSVLERVADWRNTILRAETFGFGEKQPSANRMQQTWEGGVREADHKIDFINVFTATVKKRVETYRDRVKQEVENFRRNHPKGSLPKELKNRQENLPPDLQKDVEERDRLRSNVLPLMLDKDSQLRTAIGEARESFFAGGENRIGPNGAGIKSEFAKRAIIPLLPLAGSGSFEERLQEVQGLHIYPDQHELLGADALAGPNQAGGFGGVIWDVRESIKELGLKIKQATGSVQKASFEKPEDETSSSNDSERVALLEGLLKEANQRTLVSETLGRTISKFNASYPFAGTFHTGGVIPGPSNAESLALVRGRETVLTPEQMDAMGSGAIDPGDVAVHVHGTIISDLPDPVEVVIGDRRYRKSVEEIQRSAPLRGRSAPRF